MVDNWNFYFSNCSLGRFAWDKHHRLPLQIFQLQSSPGSTSQVQTRLNSTVTPKEHFNKNFNHWTWSSAACTVEAQDYAQWKPDNALSNLNQMSFHMHCECWMPHQCGAVFCSELKWWWVRCYIFRCIWIIYSCAASNLSNQSLSWVCKYYMIYHHIIKPLRKCYWTACCGNENSETSSQKGQKPFWN